MILKEKRGGKIKQVSKKTFRKIKIHKEMLQITFSYGFITVCALYART